MVTTSLGSLLGIAVLRLAVVGVAEPAPLVPTDDTGLASPVPAASAFQPGNSPPSPDQPSRYQLTMSGGFSHWYGGTFGSPVGTYTPGLSIVMRPGMRWIEVGLHYTLSMVKLSSQDGDASRVGFAMLGANVLMEIRQGSQRLVIGCGNHVGFVHTSEGVGIEFGAGLLARYLVDVTGSTSVGPFFEIRALLYKLPGSGTPIYEYRDERLIAGHSDAQVHLGVAVTLW